MVVLITIYVSCHSFFLLLSQDCYVIIYHGVSAPGYLLDI